MAASRRLRMFFAAALALASFVPLAAAAARPGAWAPRGNAASLVGAGIPLTERNGGEREQAGGAPGRSAPGVTAGLKRADAATERDVNRWMESVASGWSPNLGQIADADGHVAANVLFSTTIRDAQVYVTTTGITHYFLSRRSESGHETRPGRGMEAMEVEPIEWARLDLELPGATIRADLARPEQPLAEQGSVNYYLPQCPDGALGVPAYRSVRFPEVYPGIDWVVRSEPGKGVHHDFVVRPGADAARIRLEYKGASSIELSDDGRTLRVRTALGEVREGALQCYQGDPSRPVGARFRVEGRSVSVVVDAYDHAAPLVIDPPLTWSTYYGGSDFDGPRSIWCDNLNNTVYVVGYTNSSDLPLMNALGGSYYQGTTGGGTNGFIWKFNQLGVRQWATYYGGSQGEVAGDCIVDGSGNLYVIGETGSTDFPLQTLGGAYNQAANGSYTDAFVLKFNALGVRQWATYYGGNGDDYGTGVTVDPTGKVYVCGFTNSTNLPLANPGGGAYYQSTPNSIQDAFITRFSALGALEWATYFGGAGPGFDGDDDAWGITTSAGRLFVTGSSRSPSLPTFNPLGGAYFQPVRAGDQDAYIARFTLAGVQTWTTYFGGDSTDYGDEPIVDGNGNVTMCGYTLSPNLPTFNPGGPAYVVNTQPGGYDLFLAQFSSTNAPVWATYLGGTNDEFLQGGWGKPMAVDAQNRLTFTAMTFSTDFPVASAYQNTSAGNMDAVITQFASNRALVWSTYFGASAPDFGTSVAIGGQGCLFATGESWNGGSLVGVNPGFGTWFQPVNAGSDDGYLARFCSPNSACCLDNNCVAVSSQAECTAMGGTAFYPNQPCSTTVCTILCSICGKKFSDSNRNGVQDGGEPGLSGWTIELRYPGGALYAMATTDGSGNYCFNGIPCGSWEVTEAHQPGWVQTYPSTAGHTLSLGTGTTQNGVNFGNYACASTAPCVNPPIWMGGWWGFSEAPGTTSTADATHLDPARNAAQLQGGAMPDSFMLCADAAPKYAQVPAANQHGLDFGTGSFSIAAWIDPTSSGASPRGIVEKREGSTLGSRGWALYLDGLQSMLEIGTGGTSQVVPGPGVTPDAWSHLAVSVDRAAGQGRWYLNGAPVAAFNFTPAAGDVSSAADLFMGQVNPAFGPAPGFQGCIADVAVFSAPLDASAANKAWIPGPISWCPEYAVMPQVTTLCKTRTSAQVCFNICNSNPTPQSYHWSLAGLPAGPGCSNAGPVQFTPSSGTIVVPPGNCSAPICVTIQRPVGFTAQNATSCFALTFVNDVTGRCQTRTGKLRVDNSCWCITPAQSGVVSVPARVAAGTVIGIGVGYPCDPQATLAYRLSAVWLDPDHEDPLAVSLNGLPPGTPVTGSITVEANGSGNIPVSVRYPLGYDPNARYEIVLDADTDGDGVYERQCGTVVQSTYDTTATVDVAPAAAPERSLRLLVSPNPFFGGSNIEFTLSHPEDLDLGVYDLSGRLVRSLARGRLALGPHRFTWNGRDDDGRRAAAGVYFVRLGGNGRHLEAKLIKVQ